MGATVSTPCFEPLARHPDLHPLRDAWRCVRDEARSVLDLRLVMGDRRARPSTWQVVPLLVEDEDRGVFPFVDLEAARRRMPTTWELAGRVGGLRSVAVSVLEPGALIATHRHGNPYLAASLCLRGGAGCTLHVGPERRAFLDGGMHVFDYRQDHAVVHAGAERRVALILSFEPPIHRSGPGNAAETPSARPGTA